MSARDRHTDAIPRPPAHRQAHTKMPLRNDPQPLYDPTRQGYPRQGCVREWMCVSRPHMTRPHSVCHMSQWDLSIRVPCVRHWCRLVQCHHRQIVKPKPSHWDCCSMCSYPLWHWQSQKKRYKAGIWQTLSEYTAALGCIADCSGCVGSMAWRYSFIHIHGTDVVLDLSAI